MVEKFTIKCSITSIRILFKPTALSYCTLFSRATIIIIIGGAGCIGASAMQSASGAKSKEKRKESRWKFGLVPDVYTPRVPTVGVLHSKTTSAFEQTPQQPSVIKIAGAARSLLREKNVTIPLVSFFTLFLYYLDLQQIYRALVCTHGRW